MRKTNLRLILQKGVIHSQHYLKNYHYLLLKFNELFNETTRKAKALGCCQEKCKAWYSFNSLS